MVIERFRSVIFAIAVVIIAGLAVLGTQIWLMNVREGDQRLRRKEMTPLFKHSSTKAMSAARMSRMSAAPVFAGLPR